MQIQRESSVKYIDQLLMLSYKTPIKSPQFITGTGINIIIALKTYSLPHTKRTHTITKRKRKKMLRQYYLRFLPTAKVDYVFLLNLYDLADYNTDTKTYNKITYKSLAGLAQSCSVSEKTLRRHLTDTEYSPFLYWDNKTKTVFLLNDFTKTGYKTPFITLSPVEVRLLIKENDNLLCKYLIYLRYYCGYSATKRIDTTCKQFLSAIGYSSNSSYPSKISGYNTLLVKNGIIKINKIHDEAGHLRNIYSF